MEEHIHAAFQEIKSISWIRSHFPAFLFYFYWLCRWKIPEGTIIFTGESFMEQFQDLSGFETSVKRINKIHHCKLLWYTLVTSYDLWYMAFLRRKLWSEGFWEESKKIQMQSDRVSCLQSRNRWTVRFEKLVVQLWSLYN